MFATTVGISASETKLPQVAVYPHESPKTFAQGCSLNSMTFLTHALFALYRRRLLGIVSMVGLFNCDLVGLALPPFLPTPISSLYQLLKCTATLPTAGASIIPIFRARVHPRPKYLSRGPGKCSTHRCAEWRGLAPMPLQSPPARRRHRPQRPSLLTPTSGGTRPRNPLCRPTMGHPLSQQPRSSRLERLGQIRNARRPSRARRRRNPKISWRQSNNLRPTGPPDSPLSQACNI